MKTQQRSFVVEIKSARRRSKMAPKSIWGDTDFKALVREAEASHLFKHDVVAEAPSPNEDPVTDLQPQETPADIDAGEEQQVETSLIDADQPSRHQAEDSTVSTVLQEQISAAKRPTRRRSEPRRDTGLEPAVGGERKASTVLASHHSEPSSDEIAVLENENRHLKLLLAKQLRQENLQLREMLERFPTT